MQAKWVIKASVTNILQKWLQMDLCDPSEVDFSVAIVSCKSAWLQLYPRAQPPIYLLTLEYSLFFQIHCRNVGSPAVPCRPPMRPCASPDAPRRCASACDPDGELAFPHFWFGFNNAMVSYCRTSLHSLPPAFGSAPPGAKIKTSILYPSWKLGWMRNHI